MPLSFRRSFKKIPSADINKNKRRLGRAASAKVVRASGEFRPTRYPLAVPIGCGVAIGLCAFVGFSRGLVRLPWVPTAAPVDYAGLATSAFETALADQLSTLEAQRPTATPSAEPTPTATSTPPLVVAPPANPWTAKISDAACIPLDLPQTGRVVEVVDGDTIKVLLDGDGHVYSVRYLGADAPETSGGTSGFGLEAMARNTELVYRKQAIMVRDITDSDSNGTLLRYVMVEGVFVNHALISGGLARANLAPPDTACLGPLLSAEQQAQAGGLGMWGGGGNKIPLPTAP